jgi:hypothetical protein
MSLRVTIRQKPEKKMRWRVKKPLIVNNLQSRHYKRSVATAQKHDRPV